MNVSHTGVFVVAAVSLLTELLILAAEPLSLLSPSGKLVIYGLGPQATGWAVVNSPRKPGPHKVSGLPEQRPAPHRDAALLSRLRCMFEVHVLE